MYIKVKVMYKKIRKIKKNIGSARGTLRKTCHKKRYIHRERI